MNAITAEITPLAAAPRANRQRWIELFTGLGFAAPAFILLVLTNLAPLGALAFLSFTNYELGALGFSFVGLKNFGTALQDPVIRRSITNTLLYVAIVVPGGVLISLLVAILIHERKRSRSVYEVIYFLPVTSTLIAMATMWQFVLHPTLGLINQALKGLGFVETAFLSEPRLVIPTLAAIGIWQLVGFNMVLFLAGLSAIPRDLYEAVDIDGASHPIDRFVKVTWPMLGPTTMFVTVTTFVSAFKIFDTVAVMTRGGPGGASEVLLYAIYLEGFQYFHMSYAATLTLIFLAFTLVFSVLQTFVIDRRVHY
ncbi:carbohydrate ABC transporter permease [Bradyrhizobium sp. CB1015]|uniref:carbohydrate ABC transporter permease n=1 Tax=Bradyrhizobium sp. CB1015 TaxID=2976822 RepID=UPI0021AA2051|nr:sugar ABC transporter permease [Bradyrhizobium sp. CB1015]UWU90750.1 sugar ABC transporter permease [Bradyrhizobium sp. CB1015]